MADGNIFISYRRGADSNAAGRLYDRLERNFDHQRLFFDMDSIPLGVDFAEHIDGEVAKCDVQLVVIGPGWLDEIARLSDPDDFVRIEIESALKRPDIPVVPVLLEGAEMPVAEDLPESLRPLVRRNAIVLGHAHFAQVVDGRLTDALRAVLGTDVPKGNGPEKGAQTPPRTRGRAKWVGIFGLPLLAVLGAGVMFYIQPDFFAKGPDSAAEETDTPGSGDAAPPGGTSQEFGALSGGTGTSGFDDTATIGSSSSGARVPETQESADGRCAGRTTRDDSLSNLHPALREKVRLLEADLSAEKIPFEVFEAYTSPARQEYLYAQGRTRPGVKVTWVGPWRSVHQFGLAVNFALRIDGKWSWDDQGDEAEYWERLKELGEKHGLTSLYNSSGKWIEKGHLQLPDLAVSEIYESGFPAGGDMEWASNLIFAIDAEQTCLGPSEKAKLLDHVTTAAFSKEVDAQFLKLHAFIRSAEGGFVYHPQDISGAANMGVTQAMLADWRNREVTVEDVRNLTRAEADAILKSNYYDVCRCGEMPERTAMAVYNAAVMHGCGRAIRFLQTAFNDLGMTIEGEPLKVDGIIASRTLAAAQQMDSKVLSEAILDEHEDYLRSLDAFKTYGRYWLNRFVELRDFLDGLPREEGLDPTSLQSESDPEE